MIDPERTENRGSRAASSSEGRVLGPYETAYDVRRGYEEEPGRVDRRRERSSEAGLYLRGRSGRLLLP